MDETMDPDWTIRSFADWWTMPILTMFFDAQRYLQKPYVTGMTPNVLDIPEFKGVWIDTNWRPS